MNATPNRLGRQEDHARRSRITPFPFSAESFWSSFNVAKGNDMIALRADRRLPRHAACAPEHGGVATGELGDAARGGPRSLIFWRLPPPCGQVLIFQLVRAIDLVLILTTSFDTSFRVLVLIGTSKMSTCSYGHVFKLWDL